MRLVLLLLAPVLLLCGDWPQFRGPGGEGHSGEQGLPLKWSGTENVVWKVALPGRGWSSPSIQGTEIWLTTATREGHSLRAIAIHRESGKLLRDVEVFQVADPVPINGKNSHASPTPIVDGDRIYLHYGSSGTACIKTSGETVWKTRLDYRHQHGSGGSPVLYNDLLIVNCDGTDTQYVAALDKNTGKVRWKTRRDGYQAYSTPLIVHVDGKDQLVSVGAKRAVSYDPRTGKEIWSISYGDGFSNVPRPVYGHGLVYICSGFHQPYLFAVRPTGTGDVTDTEVAWVLKRSVPLTPSPLLVGEELYTVTDNGIASCLDAKTGNIHWQERLGGSHSASPTFADGRIYFLSEEGDSTVIAPGRKFEKLAVNRLGEATLASMAISGGAIFIRGERHLYRIQEIRDKTARK
ncbi:MAG: PQQ-binding-like beta-propeller repeat protein [Bryobacteraceae bacterium]